MTRFNQIGTLEKMVSETSLKEVLYDLAVVCGVKYDDAKQAHNWREQSRWDWNKGVIEAAETSVDHPVSPDHPE